MSKVTRHVPYIPHPGYERLSSTGLRRFPQCVRENVTVTVPKALRAWLPILAHVKVRALLSAFTVN
jgi:hypothetical protein